MRLIKIANIFADVRHQPGGHLRLHPPPRPHHPALQDSSDHDQSPGKCQK